jgi:hypothetical protein
LIVIKKLIDQVNHFCKKINQSPTTKKRMEEAAKFTSIKASLSPQTRKRMKEDEERKFRNGTPELFALPNF